MSNDKEETWKFFYNCLDTSNARVLLILGVKNFSKITYANLYSSGTFLITKKE